ncbi:MAG: hypothetical protein H0Z38_00765 [Firmicutes bacterium]|nr:hypothetical protein [Bacillota bacterium]
MASFFIAMAIVIATVGVGLKMFIWGKARCPQCGSRLKTVKTVLKEPTETDSGSERVIYNCPHCPYCRTTQAVLPALVAGKAAGRRGIWFGWVNRFRRV